eukprot:CAMPEP_0185832074 /NCGR_PEP_ID=MMETSP1353-20130828/1872_1 /TAXON_ID=1077150 /ORGANISM="Erythrolobus australicus, Strain CCMP3124" /LENGTH=261 /DNA_ID=CAMNT_0028530213 /DNA_START=251 /DNA_END=1034 /DNA_ORIENTATION=-
MSNTGRVGSVQERDDSVERPLSSPQRHDSGEVVNCSALTAKYEVLARHVAPRREGREFAQTAHACASCKYASSNRSNLLYHVLSKHLQLLPFGCVHCASASASYTNLTHHYSRLHGQRLSDPGVFFKCSACSAPHTAPLELLDHFLHKHGPPQRSDDGVAFAESNLAHDEVTPQSLSSPPFKVPRVETSASLDRALAAQLSAAFTSRKRSSDPGGETNYSGKMPRAENDTTHAAQCAARDEQDSKFRAVRQRMSISNFLDN